MALAPVMVAGAKAIVDISAARVVLEGFTIQGLASGPADSIRYGVRIHDGGSATVTGDRVTGIRDADLGDGSANGFGIYANTNGFVAIENNTVDNYQKGGILVKGGARGEVENNIVRGAGTTGAIVQNGIQIGDAFAEAVRDFEVEHNLVTGNDYANSAVDGFEAGGILILNQNGGVSVEGNWLTGNQDAIFLAGVANLRVKHNVAVGNSADGILLTDGTDPAGPVRPFGNRIDHNLVLNNGREGIDLFDSDNNHIDHNVLLGNAADGISLTTSNGNKIDHNVAERNALDGIVLFSSSGNTIDHNDADDNGQDSIGLNESPGNTLDHNDVHPDHPY
jgi:parallel beta-helix repeat protein